MTDRQQSGTRGAGWAALAALVVFVASGCAKDEAPATERVEAAPQSTAVGAAAPKSAPVAREEPAASGDDKRRKDLAPGDGVAQAPREGRDPAPPPPAFAAAAEADEESSPSLAKGDLGGMGLKAKGPARISGGAAIPGSPPPPDAYAVPADAPIDPNGRFATTYRPGGGHLAAFEAAVSRGIVPEAERAVVGDIGARYAPAYEIPKDRAIALYTDFERTKLPPSGGPVHVRLALQSTEQAATERPRLSVHLVLDVSGSMRGAPMEAARQAAKALVEKLDDKDQFSLVTFSTGAAVKVPAGLVEGRKPEILGTIAGITEGGGTNIGEGLRLGYEEAKKPDPLEDAVRVVMLLSDGRANSGITQPASLSGLALTAFQDGIQTSTFGLGSDYDGALMSSIAGDGAGGYYYLRDPDQIAPALAVELDKRLDPVATALELRVRLRPDVELLHVYGSRRLSDAEAGRVRTIEVAADKQAEARDGIAADRQEDLEGGMRFFIPAFAGAESHAILLKLRVAGGVGDRPLATVEVKYKDRVHKKNVLDEVPVALTYADSDAQSAATIDRSVARTVQGFAAGETLARAAHLIAQNQRQPAASLLAEREGLLREAALSLEEPLFLLDADRLARLRFHASSGHQGFADPLVLAMVLETAGRVHMR